MNQQNDDFPTCLRKFEVTYQYQGLKQIKQNDDIEVNLPT